MQQRNIDFIEKLSLNITKRPLVYCNDRRHHTLDTIRVNNPFIGLHEICHWIAADPAQRHLFNLGLPLSVIEYCDSSIEVQNRMDSEEAVALSMPLLFAERILFKDEFILDKAKRMKNIALTYSEPMYSIEARTEKLFAEWEAKLRGCML